MIPLLIASLGAGAIGALTNASAQDRANMLQNQAMQQWFAVNIPDPAQQQIAMQQFVQTGQLHPVLQQQIKQSQSNLNNVQLNPDMTNARLRALGSLEQTGYGGQQIQDAAALQKSLIEVGAQGGGQQKQVLQSLAQRGQLGSGAELQARLSAAQNSQNNLANQGLDLEMQRRQRALRAVQGAGQLAGDIQNTQYSADANRAKANDMINQFNTQNLVNTQAANVGSQNAANLYNLQNQQNVSNMNTQLQNQQQLYNKGLLQQNFQNQLAKAAGASGQLNTNANQAISQGQTNANMWGGISGALGKIGQSYGSAGNSNTSQQGPYSESHLYESPSNNWGNQLYTYDDNEKSPYSDEYGGLTA
jgi:hypothetical protein